MPELERMRLTRIVARPEALDAAAWPKDALVFRVAPDEVLIHGTGRVDVPGDPHAIVESEEGFAAVWVEAQAALEFLERACEWELPRERPSFAQGAVAGLPVKLWLERERVLFLAPAPFAADLRERMA